MTVTKMQTSYNSDHLSYEVELEISKVDYLLQFANDEFRFRSIIRRFLQNSASLTHLLASSKHKAKEIAQA